jgi:hypothetical protein
VTGTTSGSRRSCRSKSSFSRRRSRFSRDERRRPAWRSARLPHAARRSCRRARS